jgi:hypothetical protein
MRRDQSETLVHGCIAGLVAYAVIVVVYAAGNLLLGRSPLATASALGGALFPYLADPAAGISITAAIAYNGVHMVGSMVVGMAAAWVLHELDLHPAIWYPVFFVATAAVIFVTVYIALLVRELSGATSWASIVAANFVALLSAVAYLWRTHPGLGERIARFAEIE